MTVILVVRAIEAMIRLLRCGATSAAFCMTDDSRGRMSLDAVRVFGRSARDGSKLITREEAMQAASSGRRVYGIGVIALALVALASADFLQGQPVPGTFPGRSVAACAAALMMLVGGASVEWRRTAAAGAAVLTAYYALVVVILMNGRVLAMHYTQFGAYSGTAEQLAIAAAALIVYAHHARLEAPVAARLARIGRITFGVCAVLFGIAHFVYMDLTAPLVPRWLPPSQEFWGYATGVGQIAAGIAVSTGFGTRLAAVLLTAMYVVFALLVHAPMLVADPSSLTNWNENALNLALVGVAWVVADSTGRWTRAV